MADLAQNLINNYMQRKSAESKQATIDTLTGLGSTQAPQAPDLAANSYIGMFGKGMEGLINFAQTGDRNRAAAAEQARLDEATAYERERNAFNDALATRTAERADKELGLREKKYQFEAGQANKQEQDAIWKREAATLLKGAQDEIFTTNRDRDAKIQTLTKGLIGSGVDLVQGTDGTWGVSADVAKTLTPEQLGQIDELNKTYNSGITGSSLNVLAERLHKQGKSTANPYDDYSISELTQSFESKAGEFGKLSATEDKKRQEKLGLIQDTAAAEVSTLLKGKGYTKGTVGREMLDDEMWAYNGNLGENYAQDSIMNNKAIKDKDAALVELTNRREELLQNETVKELLDKGQVSQSQFEAALGKTFSTVSDNFWQWSVGIKDDNIITPFLNYLGNAADVNDIQFKVDQIKSDALTSANKVNAYAKLGVVM